MNISSGLCNEEGYAFEIFWYSYYIRPSLSLKKGLLSFVFIPEMYKMS